MYPAVTICSTLMREKVSTSSIFIRSCNHDKTTYRFPSCDLPSSSSSGRGGRPHHSRWNFSCSRRFFAFSSLSRTLTSWVVSHSSLAASCSPWVAYDIMQEFIESRSVRHAHAAENVRCKAQEAKSDWTRMSAFKNTIAQGFSPRISLAQWARTRL